MSIDSVWFATLTPEQRLVLQGTADGRWLTTPDLLVVGGGLIGLAAAYFAAERGASVQVIDAGEIAGLASGANAGAICPNVGGLRYPPGYGELAQVSRDLWGRLSVRPGFDIDWKVNGALIVDPDQFPPSAEEYAARALEQGFSLHAVDAGQIAWLEPALRPGLAAGLHYPSEASLHPVKAAAAFVRGIVARGGAVRSGVRATGVETAGGRVVSVQTTAGPIAAGQIISATGRTADWLAEVLSRPLPVRAMAGQMLATESLPPLIKGAVIGKFVMLQLRSGELITGGGEWESDDPVPDPARAAEIQAAAIDLIPALREVPFTRSWRGLRPWLPDGLPLVDQAEGWANLFVSCGQFKNGVLLAPLCGKLLVDWIWDGRRPAELTGWAWDRFPRAS